MKEFEVEITDFDYSYAGLGKINGKKALIDGAIPGEIVQTKVAKPRKGTYKGRVQEFIQASPERTKAKCFYYGGCGGCKWQDLNYSEQLKLKKLVVQKAFAKLGNFKDLEIPETIGSPDLFAYRTKMEFSFSSNRWLTDNEIATKGELDKSFSLGMNAPAMFNKVIDIEECHLQSNLANEILNHVRTFTKQSNLAPYNINDHTGHYRFLVIRESKQIDEIMINLVSASYNEDDIQALKTHLLKKFPKITSFYNTVNSSKSHVTMGEEIHLIHGESFIKEKLGGYDFEISPDSFFQPNTKAAEIVYQKALDFAELKGDETVFDLYSGIGSISLFISKHAKKVFGFEIIESAVKHAQENQKRNGISNCEFFSGDLKDLVGSHPAFTTEKPEVIFLDPPRAGINPKVASMLVNMDADKIIYISCNPKTQAMDLMKICSLGKYEIHKIQPIDMLPHTYHVENIVSLRKVSANSH